MLEKRTEDRVISARMNKVSFTRNRLITPNWPTVCTAKTVFLEQISNANLRFFIHPNFAFLSGPNEVDLRGISKLIEVK